MAGHDDGEGDKHAGDRDRAVPGRGGLPRQRAVRMR